MLKLATKSELDAIIEFCDDDLLGTRIGCYAIAYGFDYDFLNIWYDDSNGKIETVMSKFFDSVTIVSKSDSLKEVAEFVRMIGFKSLQCNFVVCEKLGFNPCETKKTYVFNGEAENMGAENLGEEHYKALYELVSKNIPGSFKNTKDAYLSFLSDITYKKKRGFARCKGIIIDGKLVSSVITAAETNNCALLSAVASDAEMRGKGLGKRTVLTVTDELIKENKKVFVIALNKSAESFYEKIGFSYNDSIAIIR